mgnify:CR=1 FL=1
MYYKLENLNNFSLCKYCEPFSKDEKELCEFLDSKSIKYIKNNREIIKPYELDIYIPEFNLAIEYNGLFWHCTIKKEPNYHLNKTHLCSNKKIQLIHIYEDEWKLKKDIIKSILSHKFKLNKNISIAIYRSLKDNKNGRHWEQLVGWTLDELKIHLERQFRGSMGWINYGEWEIDHRIPISAFNFDCSDHIDFRRCWALSNLQPLWAKENLSKNDKLNKDFQPSLAL